jgi:hypothetical protein
LKENQKIKKLKNQKLKKYQLQIKNLKEKLKI